MAVFKNNFEGGSTGSTVVAGSSSTAPQPGTHHRLGVTQEGEPRFQAAPGWIAVARYYRNNSRKPRSKPTDLGRPGVVYRVMVDYYPDNRWMVEARRIHTEYHRRKR